jgi:hypothetical protein
MVITEARRGIGIARAKARRQAHYGAENRVEPLVEAGLETCAPKSSSFETRCRPCDRVNDRIQVFKPDGTCVKEQFIAKKTLAAGSVWGIAFSKDL